MKIKLNSGVLILCSLALVAVTIIYFAYFRLSRREILYAGVALVKTINVQEPFFWQPQWLDATINVSDKDISTLGRVNAEIIDKESVEAESYGRYIHLLLKVEAIHTRTGEYQFKNKPLAVGNIIQLKFPKNSFYAYVQTLGEKKPDIKKRRVRVMTIFKEVEPYLESWIKVGNEVKNNKGEIIAKVVEKTTNQTRKEVHTASGQIVAATNPLKKEVYVALEILVKEEDGQLYFTDTFKVKPNEQIFVPWPSGKLYHYIISVEPV